MGQREMNTYPIEICPVPGAGAVVQQLGVLADCSCRGSGFGPQHSHGSSQLSLTLVPVALTLLTSQVPEHTQCTDTHSGTQTHKIKQKNKYSETQCQV